MKKNIILTLLCLLVSLSASAQSVGDVKINEILVKNQSGYTDDHSAHTGWIELYNSGFATANVAGLKLRMIQGSDTTTYTIPKSDARTAIAPQGYAIFFASGHSDRGTFHTNFLMDSPGVPDVTLELLNQGDNVIDFIKFNQNQQKPDISYGRISNVDDETVFEYSELSSTTPLQSNEVRVKVPKNEIFRREDPSGTSMAAVAMSVVFAALLALFSVFAFIGYMNKRNVIRKRARSIASYSKARRKGAQSAGVEVPKKIKSGQPSGEELAAISVAINMYFQELHDIESEIVTINQVQRVYSPWSSKIHTLTKNPRG